MFDLVNIVHIEHIGVLGKSEPRIEFKLSLHTECSASGCQKLLLDWLILLTEVRVLAGLGEYECSPGLSSSDHESVSVRRHRASGKSLCNIRLVTF